ncbi:hypothetical protein HZS_3100, partial [Henneguya salminicola]
MKFTQQIKAAATPEWKLYYLNYSKLRKIIENCQNNAPNLNTLQKIEQFINTLENEFFHLIDLELRKVNLMFSFNLERINEAERIFNDLKKEIGSSCLCIQNIDKTSQQDNTHVENAPSTENDVIQRPILDETLDYELMKKMRKKNKKIDNFHKTLKLATSEFYLYLNQIKTFQTLNFTGFRKILKKFDKVFKSSKGKQFLKISVQSSSFYVNSDSDCMCQDIEEIYIKIFSCGDRSKGMKKLRVPSININKKCKNIKSPFLPVSFSDFWMFDQLCTLSPALVALLGYTPCVTIRFFMHDDVSFCLKPIMIFSSIVRIFPYYVRFMQCCRRFNDFQKMTFYWAVLTMRFISTTYLLFWDVWIDWSFFGTPAQLKSCNLSWTLRKNIIYPYRFLYYLALVQNLIVRYLSLAPPILSKYVLTNHEITLIYIGVCINLLEIVRRIIWNFLRLENEHLNNVGRYRTIRDIAFFDSKSNRSVPISIGGRAS